MKITKTLSLISIALASTSALAFNDLRVENHSDAFVTTKTQQSPCSSSVGEMGILEPHSAISIPEFIQDVYCDGGCDVDLYVSKNCSGPSVVTAHFELMQGITNITNHTPNAYQAIGNGFNISFEGNRS